MAIKGKKVIEKKAQQLERLNIQYVAHDKITPNSYNPNRQNEDEYELLIASITEDGFTQPVVAVPDPAREGKVVIVDGEHRWRASQEINKRALAAGKPAPYPEIPIVVVPMTPEQARIATLRHNRARGTEDIELSAQVLRDLREMGALEWAADSLQLDDVELNRLLEDIPAPDALAGEEFGESWEPDTYASGDDIDGNRQTVDAHDVQRPTYMQREAMTPEAVDAIRERERALARATTDEEKATAKKETDVFRLSLMFTGEQARVVKKILGGAPAVKLLELCEKEDQLLLEDLQA